MKNSTRFTLVTMLLVITSGVHAQRILRWQVSNMPSNTYDIRNTNNSNTFLHSSNWRIVDANTGSVTSTSAAPINGDTLQIFNASMSLSTNFDMTALQNIVLDFGDPRSGLSWSLLVKRDFTWLLHSTAKINVRWGDLVTEIDNVAPINTGIKIGGVFKLMAVDFATVTVHGPSHADMTTPVTTSILQEGFTAGTLPVVLVDFDAVKQNSGVQITWRTQQEYNTKVFNIERSSDGKNFISIASVPAAGNSTVPRSYSYTDQSTTTGISYYRVRIVSNDMISGFTSVKAVRASMLTRLGLFPNPAQSTTNLIINNPESIAFNVNVFNSFGQMVQQRKVAGGTNTLSLDVHALQAGDYTVDIQMADGSRQNAKLIIKK